VTQNAPLSLSGCGAFLLFLGAIPITDSTMLKTILWVSFFTICICWVIGAYNRMVRMRAVAAAIDATAVAVSQYNQAIKQFPASLLAAVFAFKSVIHNDDKTT
jgi:hypothetical protein